MRHAHEVSFVSVSETETIEGSNTYKRQMINIFFKMNDFDQEYIVKYEQLLKRADELIVTASKEEGKFSYLSLDRQIDYFTVEAFNLAIDNDDPQRALNCAKKYNLGKPKVDKAQAALED